ncbi:hypothetical protein, partial [Pseudoxanthomonas kaohsiungensis]|uniref:hypothetical protein n=1 Tax=Pseudoxanthomonas kaohsiungensis TaxID=283923 RepID=UPI001EE41932
QFAARPSDHARTRLPLPGLQRFEVHCHLLVAQQVRRVFDHWVPHQCTQRASVARPAAAGG